VQHYESSSDSPSSLPLNLASRRSFLRAVGARSKIEIKHTFFSIQYAFIVQLAAPAGRYVSRCWDMTLSIFRHAKCSREQRIDNPHSFLKLDTLVEKAIFAISAISPRETNRAADAIIRAT